MNWWWNDENRRRIMMLRKIELCCWWWKSHDGIFREKCVFYLLRKVCVVSAVSATSLKILFHNWVLSHVGSEIFLVGNVEYSSRLLFDIWTSSIRSFPHQNVDAFFVFLGQSHAIWNRFMSHGLTSEYFFPTHLPLALIVTIISLLCDDKWWRKSSTLASREKLF